MLETCEPQERLNVPVNRIRGAMEWLERVKELPPRVAITIHASMWFLQVDSFRNCEEELLVQGTYEDSLGEHRLVLTQLLADGSKLLYGADKLGLELEAKFSVDDIRATVESLRITLNCQHGPKNPDTVGKLIEGLFDVEERQG